MDALLVASLDYQAEDCHPSLVVVATAERKNGSEPGTSEPNKQKLQVYTCKGVAKQKKRNYR